MGLRRFSRHPTPDHRQPPRRPRHPRPHAHRRRQEHHLPSAGAHDGGHVLGHHAAHCADERPGGEPPPAKHPRHSHSLRTFARGNQPRTRQRHPRPIPIPLPFARTHPHRTLPLQTRLYESEFHRGGRGALHLPMGLRLPPLLLAGARNPPPPAHRAHLGTHRHGNGPSSA